MSSGTYKDMYSGLQSSQHPLGTWTPACCQESLDESGSDPWQGRWREHQERHLGARLCTDGAETRGGGVQMLNSSSDGGIAGI